MERIVRMCVDECERVGDSKVSCVGLFVTERCIEDGNGMVE